MGLCLLCCDLIEAREIPEHYKEEHPEWYYSPIYKQIKIFKDQYYRRELVFIEKTHTQAPDACFYRGLGNMTSGITQPRRKKYHCEDNGGIQKQKLIPHKHPLKPWKDPESLFCDTEFLTEYFKKKPRNGKECRSDNYDRVK